MGRVCPRPRHRARPLNSIVSQQPMTPSHIKIITAAAKRHLSPLGLVQRGRSRAWVDDQRWYITVVEFQPSSYGAGSFLNVGAQFLWHASGSIEFHWGHRIEEFREYVNDQQFAAAAEELASSARSEVERIRMQLTSTSVVSDLLPVNDGSLVTSFNHAVSRILRGDVAYGRMQLSRVCRHCAGDAKDPLGLQAASLLSRVRDAAAFKAAVHELIRMQRKLLKLAECEVTVAG